MNQYTPLYSAQLWSDPVGARQLRAKALRRRTPLARDGVGVSATARPLKQAPPPIGAT